VKPETETNTASLTVIGVDIGKELFHLVGLGVDGKIAFRRRIRRLSLKEAFEKLPPCIVGMEACLSAHFVSRTLRALGHQPRIIPAIYVKPFVKGQKNDYNDAEAIAEAALRPNLRVVKEKSQDQLDLQACHRGPVSVGVPSNGNDQSDPRFSDRAGDRGQIGPACAPQLAFRNIGEPKGRDFTENCQADPRPLRRLVLPGRAH
jgi:hypothetical protein